MKFAPFSFLFFSRTCGRAVCHSILQKKIKDEEKTTKYTDFKGYRLVGAKIKMTLTMTSTETEHLLGRSKELGKSEDQNCVKQYRL